MLSGDIVCWNVDIGMEYGNEPILLSEFGRMFIVSLADELV